jgi:hypothetical protein
MILTMCPEKSYGSPCWTIAFETGHTRNVSLHLEKEGPGKIGLLLGSVNSGEGKKVPLRCIDTRVLSVASDVKLAQFLTVISEVLGGRRFPFQRPQ